LGWLDRFRKVRISPEDLAQSLFDVFVQEGCDEQLTERARVPEELRPRFDQKIELYSEALMLMVLASESQAHASFKRVLLSYEAIVFGVSPAISGFEKVTAIRAAMKDLNSLFGNDAARHELRWSLAWFQEIGHGESNPIVLALFATFWMDRYIAATKSVREFALI
jgi:hypothetical protein